MVNCSDWHPRESNPQHRHKFSLSITRSFCFPCLLYHMNWQSRLASSFAKWRKDWPEKKTYEWQSPLLNFFPSQTFDMNPTNLVAVKHSETLVCEVLDRRALGTTPLPRSEEYSLQDIWSHFNKGIFGPPSASYKAIQIDLSESFKQ